MWDAGRETEKYIRARNESENFNGEVDEEMKQQAKEKQTIMAIKTQQQQTFFVDFYVYYVFFIVIVM